MTTFARACAPSMYRMASGTSSKAKVRSRTGRIEPASTSSATSRRPSAVGTDCATLVSNGWNRAAAIAPGQQPHGTHDASLPGNAATGQHQPSTRSYRAPQLPQRAVPDEVDDGVVGLSDPSEVGNGVVDDLVRAERLSEVDVAGADHRGHLQAHGLGRLHREGPYATGGAVDEDRAALAQSRFPQAQKRRRSCQRQARRLGEAHPRRQDRELVLGGEGVVGEGAGAFSEHGVADLPAGDVGADGVDDACQVRSADHVTGRPKAEGGAVDQPRDAWFTTHHVPVTRVERRGVDPDPHLPGRWRRRELACHVEDFGAAVAHLSYCSPGRWCHSPAPGGAEFRRLSEGADITSPPTEGR